MRESKLKDITEQRGKKIIIHAFAVITLAKTCLLRHPGEPYSNTSPPSPPSKPYELRVT